MEKIVNGVVSDPGRISSVQAEGIVVAAGIHELLVREIRLGDGNQVISGRGIATALCVDVGDVLS